MSSTEAPTKEIYDPRSYDPKRSIGGLLGRVKMEMSAALDAELARLDITAAQYVILMSIALGEADSASGLCKGISYDPGASAGDWSVASRIQTTGARPILS